VLQSPRCAHLGLAGISLATLFFAIWPILSTPFFGDDIPNSQRSAYLEFSDESAWGYVVSGTHQWMVNEGRFFPVAVIENVILFDNVHSRWIYKVLQLSLTASVALLIGYFVYLLSKSISVGIFSPIIFVAVLQVRNWHDPTIAFGLLLQSTTIKFLLTAICLILALESPSPSRRYALFLMAVVMWSAGLLQYEIILFTAPALLLIVWFTGQAVRRIRITASALIIGPALLVLGFVLFLRTQARPSIAYTINSDLGTFFSTLTKQTSGALPLATSYLQRGYATPSSVVSDWRVIVFLLLVAAVTTYLMAITKEFLFENLRMMFGIGLVVTIFPAITTALSVRWQSEVTWGRSYLSVFVQYVGMSLLITALLMLLLKRSQKWTLGSRSLTLFPFVLFVLLCVSVNASSFRRVAEAITPLRTSRELFEDAVRGQLLTEIPYNAVVFSPESDLLWVNAIYVEWLGGPVQSNFVRPEGGLLTTCNAHADQCSVDREWFGLTMLETTPGSEVLAVARFKHSDLEFMGSAVIGVVRVASRRIENLPKQCRVDLKNKSGLATAKCDESVLSLGELLP